MKFVCKCLSRPSKAFLTGTDEFFIPETSHEACLHCESDCELFGECSHCIFSSECSSFKAGGKCQKNKPAINKEASSCSDCSTSRENGKCPLDKSDYTVRFNSEDELPF